MTPVVGLLLRLDSGGLAAQSRLIHDLINPHAVVAVDMGGDSRGPTHPTPDGALTLPHRAAGIDAARKAARHLRACDVVWTAESPYWPRLAHQLPGRLAVHANPELYSPEEHAPTTLVALPTHWHTLTLPHPVVPHPTPFDQPGWAEVREENVSRVGPARRVLHVAAPAMLDRNGTVALIEGLAGYTGPEFTLLVAGSGLGPARRPGRRVPVDPPDRLGAEGQVTVERVGEVVDRLDLYRDVDLLVLPRRYGGLCLVAQEAAAAGVPVLMSDLAPQTGWRGVEAGISCRRGTVERMRGGRFRVAAPDPVAVRETVNRYTSDEGEHRHAWQTMAVAWARDHAWAGVAQVWDKWLDPS